MGSNYYNTDIINFRCPKGKTINVEGDVLDRLVPFIADGKVMTEEIFNQSYTAGFKGSYEEFKHFYDIVCKEYMKNDE